MELAELLPKLKKYSSVLVTGPQRSGTTIGARILAHELGYRYVDENEIAIHDSTMANIRLSQGHVVVQAPALMHMADMFMDKYPIVVTRRPIEDILKSEQRIHWREAYGGLNLSVEAKKYMQRFHLASDNIAALKYHCWDTLQKQHCISFDLDYDSLKNHPLWASDHQTFEVRQWTKEQAHG